MRRPCEVWAEPISEIDQKRHEEMHGHKRHVCILEREFGQEHEGWHECSCGLHWPHLKTDND